MTCLEYDKLQDIHNDLIAVENMLLGLGAKAILEDVDKELKYTMYLMARMVHEMHERIHEVIKTHEENEN